MVENIKVATIIIFALFAGYQLLLLNKYLNSIVKALEGKAKKKQKNK